MKSRQAKKQSSRAGRWLPPWKGGIFLVRLAEGKKKEAASGSPKALNS